MSNISIFQDRQNSQTLHFLPAVHLTRKKVHFSARKDSIGEGETEKAYLFGIYRLTEKLVYPEKQFFDIILAVEKEARRLGAVGERRTMEGSSSSLRASSTSAGLSSSGD